MSNKAARRRQRERERLQELEDMYASPDHFACAEADLAIVNGLLNDASDLLIELANAASGARDNWPADEEADELRAVFEAVRGLANESRAKLSAARDVAHRFRDTSHHLHVAGGRIVRMVIAGEPVATGGPDDDIPF